jgi:hypothetical protein
VERAEITKTLIDEPEATEKAGELPETYTLAI